MKSKMFFLIALSIILGLVAGLFFPEQMLALRWIGIIFINMLKLKTRLKQVGDK